MSEVLLVRAGKVYAASRSFEGLHGASVTGKEFLSIVWPADREKVEKAAKRKSKRATKAQLRAPSGDRGIDVKLKFLPAEECSPDRYFVEVEFQVMPEKEAVLLVVDDPPVEDTEE